MDPHAPIPAADQAPVIAAILDDPAPHTGQTYQLFGPVEMNRHQIAAKMARVLDRPIRYEPVPGEAFAAVLCGRGMSDDIIQHLSNVALDYQHGIFAGTDDVVERLGGRPGTTVAAFVEDRRGTFAR